MKGFGEDLGDDGAEAARLVSGMLRRGESGEALRERRAVSSWSASEAGLLSPAHVEERGTAMRIRRGRESLLVARVGDGPEALREVVREASRRAGGSPFFKGNRAVDRASVAPDPPALHSEEEARSAALAAALARAVPDPRGLTISLTISRIAVARGVITPRAYLACGTSVRLEARGTIARSDSQRVFAFQSSNPWGTAVHDLAGALQEAVKPSPRLLAPSGEMDVVLAPAAAAVFWHEAVGHPLESDGGEQSSVLARVPGAVVGPPGLHVVDDPTRTDLPGRYLVDDEGIAAHTIPLIADGQIAGLLTDRRSAGADSNGHGRATDYRSPVRARMSNLVVPPGRVPLSELIARCGYGLYVKEVSSGTSDPESGRFLLSVENAEMIRRGRLGAPVSRFTLSGDVLSALGSMDPDLGDESRPASGLSICVKAGYPIPVGGAATALLLRGLQVRGTTR